MKTEELLKRLTYLIGWMKNYRSNTSSYDGRLESAIKRGNEETIQTIGDLLEDALFQQVEEPLRETPQPGIHEFYLQKIANKTKIHTEGSDNKN